VKLGRFWPNPWPYPHELGVGLRLTGYPTCEEHFLQFLYAQSCNPIAARRILKGLKEKGEKLTTVQSSFNFELLGNEFQQLGVKMQIIPPVEQPNNTDIDCAALFMCARGDVETEAKKLSENQFLKPQQIEEARRRAQETGKLDSATLGPYSWVAKQNT